MGWTSEGSGFDFWHADRLWVPPSHLPKLTGSGGWAVKLITHLHPVPTQRTTGATDSLHFALSACPVAQLSTDNFLITITIIYLFIYLVIYLLILL
jgi:hypothetical protein